MSNRNYKKFSLELFKRVFNIEKSDNNYKKFSLELFKKVFNIEKNIVISPMSAFFAISMLANGADGETLRQIEETVGMSVEEINNYVSDYMEKIENDKNSKLKIANSIWIEDKYEPYITQEFVDINKKNYDAEVFVEEYGNEIVGRINSWCDSKTDSMIQKLIDEPPIGPMVLVNALAFVANWQKEYTRDDLDKDKFTDINGKKKNVLYMYSKEGEYFKNEKSKGFIKYYEGCEYAFVAFLPNEEVGINDYVNSLTQEDIDKLLDNTIRGEANVAIPLFENRLSVEMQKILAELGIKDVFTKNADLSRMCEVPLMVDKVIQQSYIKVDDKGTKAAAATMVTMRCACLIPTEFIYLNRPFVYMIMKCEDRKPLFMGTVLEV